MPNAFVFIYFVNMISGKNSIRATALLVICLCSLAIVGDCQYPRLYPQNLTASAFQIPYLDDDIKNLLNGVEKLNYGSAAFSSFSYSEKIYFPLTYAGSKPVTIAGRYGSGRVIMSGHGSFLATTTSDNPKFFSNIFQWMAGTKSSYNVGLFLASDWNGLGVLTKINVTLNKTVIRLDTDITDQDIIFVTYLPTRTADFTPALLNKLQTYVQNGGNLILASVGWVWRYYGEGSSDRSLVFATDFIDAVITQKFETMITEDAVTVGEFLTKGIKTANNDVIKFLQEDFLKVLKGASQTFTANSTQVDNYIKQIQTATRFDYICTVELYHQLVDAFVASRRFNIEKNYNKIKPNDPFFSQVFILINELSYAVPPEQCRALPPTNMYPGKVESKKLASKIISIPLNRTKRVHTGLYVFPGQVVKVKHNLTFAQILDVKLVVNQNEDLTGSNNGNMKRFPNIKRYFSIKIGEFLFASPHGGNIFFEVQYKRDITLDFEVMGAYESPYFNEQLHTQDDYNVIKKIKAPIFVFECQRIVISGRGGSAFTKANVNVTKICEYWNNMMGYYKDFRGTDPFPFTKEAIFCDINMRAGYMHSGFPVMTFEDVTLSLVGANRSPVMNVGWGIFHEFGHNHQDGKWTPSIYGEVTNNIYSLYMGYKLHNYDPITNPWFGSGIVAKFNNFMAQADSNKFEVYRSNYGLALYLFAVLIKDIGFEPFIAMQKAYNVMNPVPNLDTDVKKFDLLMQQLSLAANLNLWKYFKSWGIPITDESKLAVASLPDYSCSTYPILTA